MRVAQMRDALVHRHAAAHGEDHHRDNERPEVQLPAIELVASFVNRSNLLK
jgi:hypothetical protein